MSQYYNLNMTGPELEERLGKVLENESAIADETTRAQTAEASKANVDDLLAEMERAQAAEAEKADAADVYTKAQTDAAIDADVLAERQRAELAEAGKANASDVYTKTQTDAAIQTESERAQAAEATKQDVITDINAIRRGAELGSTALQEHQSLDNYYTKTEADAAIDADVLAERLRAEAEEATKANAADVYTKAQTDAAIDADVLAERQRAEAAEASKANAADVYTKTQTDAAIQTESERAQAVEATKQDAIPDLDAIRSGAELGSTALQEHQSLDNYYTKAETQEAVADNVHDAVGMIDTSRLTLSPDVVLPNVGANVTMVATTGSAADITIRDGRHIIAQGTGDELVAVEPFIPTSESYIDIVAEFRAAGITHSVTRRILVVPPVKYGAGLSVSSATTNATARKTADGEYTLNVPEDGGYIWFCLPSDMKLSKVLMTDVEMEMEIPDTTTMPGYTVYRSRSMYDEGTITVLLVGADPYKE